MFIKAPLFFITVEESSRERRLVVELALSSRWEDEKNRMQSVEGARRTQRRWVPEV